MNSGVQIPNKKVMARDRQNVGNAKSGQEDTTDKFRWCTMEWRTDAQQKELLIPRPPLRGGQSRMAPLIEYLPWPSTIMRMTMPRQPARLGILPAACNAPFEFQLSSHLITCLVCFWCPEEAWSVTPLATFPSWRRRSPLSRDSRARK